MELAKTEPESWKSEWSAHFDALVERFSQGEFDKELIRAKNLFFAKLGRGHELDESIYNAASQSFLEWYVFDYVLSGRQKTPIVTFLANDWGDEAEKAWAQHALYHHYSWYEVQKLSPTKVVLKDLLLNKSRHLRRSGEDPSFKVWRPELGQILQLRLFREQGSDWSFMTHLWIHLESERKSLLDLAAVYAKEWGDHREMLREALECLMRSMDLRDQLAAVRSQNWVYRDFYKKYLPGERKGDA